MERHPQSKDILDSRDAGFHSRASIRSLLASVPGGNVIDTYFGISSDKPVQSESEACEIAAAIDDLVHSESRAEGEAAVRRLAAVDLECPLDPALLRLLRRNVH